MNSPISGPLEALKKVEMPSAGTLVMIVALCVLGVVGWFMITEKEEYLVQRNFRLLKLWSKDISSKIEGYQQVFRFSAEGILDGLHAKSGLIEIEDVGRNIIVRSPNLQGEGSDPKEKKGSSDSERSNHDGSENSTNNSVLSTNNQDYFTWIYGKTSEEVIIEEQSEALTHTTILDEVSPWSCSLKSKVGPNSRTTQENRGTFSKLSKEEKEKINLAVNDLRHQLTGLCKAEGLRTIRLSIAEENTSAFDSTTNDNEASTDNNAERFELLIDHDKNPTAIQLTYSRPLKASQGQKSGHETETIKIIGEIDLEPFLVGLVEDSIKETIFDEVLLFDSTSTTQHKDKKASSILFDSGSQEFSWTTFQNIIEKAVPLESFLSDFFSKPKDRSQLKKELREQNSPKHFLMKLPGKTNNVFTLPLLVSGNENTSWRLVGISDHKAFENSYLAISSSFLLGVMFLILGLLLSIPFLHLITMGAKDPLRRSHVLTIVFAAFLGTGTFTFLVLDLAVYDEGIETLREKMESSAQNIKGSVHNELRKILFTLTEFDRSESIKSDRVEIDKLDRGALESYKKAMKEANHEDNNPNSPDQTDNNSARYLSVGQRSVLLEVLNERNHASILTHRQCAALSDSKRQQCYPDFLNAFWMDQDGSLRINWAATPDRGVTTNLPLRKRDYVKKVLDEPARLWKISSKSEQNESNAQYFSFFLEPIISWTTGENTVVASMASQDDQQNPNSWIAAMEFQFVSLMGNVILPPGIGFAVIENDTHQVLFHSKEGRNLRENFLLETDQNQQLRDLLTARTAGHVNGSYWGKARSFYTVPLKPLPWALVVYRDREILQSINLFGLVIAGGLYSLWSFIVYLIAWSLLRLNSKHRKAISLWPNALDHGLYVRLIGGNLVVFFVGICALWMWSGQPGLQLLIALFVTPITSLIVAWVLVKRTPSTEGGPLSTPPLRNSYAYLTTSYLLIFAVIPAFGCFSSVFHKEMTLLTQYQLLETYKSFINSRKPTIVGSPLLLQETDLRDPKSLIVKLRDRKDSLSKSIHSQFSKNTKTLLHPYETQEESSSQNKPFTTVLIEELNKLLSGNSLVTLLDFQDMPEAIKTSKILKQDDGRISSNRFLLEEAFPGDIHQLPRTFKTIPLPSGCDTKNTIEKEYYGFYSDFLLDTQWNQCVRRQDQKPQHSLFDQFFSVVSQPFLPLLKKVPLWGFIEEPWRIQEEIPNNQRPIRWDKKWDPEAETFFKDFIVRLTDSQFQVGSTLAFQPWFLGYKLDFSSITRGKTIQYILIALLFIFWLVLIPRFIATRTVFLNYPTPFRVPQELLFSSPNNEPLWPNQLILGFPGQGKTPKALGSKKEMKGHDVYFDLRTIPPEQWKDRLSKDISDLNLSDDQDLHVTIDHLERQWKDSAVNLKKLELMEWLLNRINHKKESRISAPGPYHTKVSQESKINDLVVKVLKRIISYDKS